MQNGSFTPATPRYNANEVVKKINLLSAKFRKDADLVLFIQHDGTKNNCYHPGTEEWKILSSLEVESNDLFVSKTVNDSFYRSKLNEELKSRGINELVVTGCATDFCIDATVKTALVNDYNITIISDAHTTGDRPMLKAKQIIDYFNWQWSECFETEGKITVMNLDDYLNL